MHNTEDDDAQCYIENVIYISPNKAAPKFLYNYIVENKLPLIAWDLDKRIIKKDGKILKLSVLEFWYSKGYLEFKKSQI